MAELKWTKWIKVYLFVLVGLHFTAAAEQSLNFTVRQGDRVTLPCYTNRHEFDHCGGTTWTFDDPEGLSVDLKQGIFNYHNQKSFLTRTCALVLPEVRAQAAGRYTCKQSDRSRRPHAEPPRLYLSVVTVAEQNYKDMTSLSCSVAPSERCQHRVQWLYDNRTGGNLDVEQIYENCKTTVLFNTSYLQHKSKNEKSFACLVTYADNKELQINVAPQSLEDGAVSTPRPTNRYETTTQQECLDCSGRGAPCLAKTKHTPPPTNNSALTSIMLVMRIAEVILITVIIVFIIRAKVNQKPTDDKTGPETVGSGTEMRSGPEASQVQNNGDEPYATICYENSSFTPH